MDYQNIAKILGQRGGLKRAQNLSFIEKKRIARMGAKGAKAREAIRQINPPSEVKSVKSTNRKLPSVHEQ